MNVKVKASVGGGSATLIYVGPTYEEVQSAAEFGLRLIDKSRAPYMAQEPVELECGNYEARINYSV